MDRFANLARLAALVVAAALALGAAPSALAGERKVVLVTFDGVRWQDVFRGADPRLVDDPRYVNPDIKDDVVAPPYVNVPDRAAALMPFLHGVVARQGVLIGDRDKGECAKVANDLWFSYPGYSEFLTGKPDPALTDNGKVRNPNVTFLEYLQRRPDYHGKVAAVGTWDVFPYIINTERTDLPVNAGFAGTYPTDVKTAREGLRLLARHDQRVVFIAFGDTDEFAHAGDYAHYLMSLERGDDFLRQVWDQLQSDPYYRGQTTLMVSTDHGRGEEPLAAWREHGSRRAFQLTPKEAPEYNETGVPGSDNVWMAAIGPAVDPAGAAAYRGGGCARSRQIAASALTALGVDWRGLGPDVGAPLSFIAAPR
jgi:hypothetical protein